MEEIRDNRGACIVEGESEGWLGEVERPGQLQRCHNVYLCFRLALAGKPDAEGIHVSTLDPVKGDTWHRGMEELEALGRARSENTRAAKGRWSTDLRKVYYLNSDYLETTDNPLEPLA